MNDEEHAALANYLAPPRTEAGVMVTSALQAVLRDARGVTGRDPDTGTLREVRHAATWLGATGYLIALDQLGKAVKPAGVAPPERPFFKACLENFAPDLGADDVRALYSLRNSFAHDFSLASQRQGLDEGPDHRHRFFALDTVGPLVVHPPVQWTGRYEDVASN